MISIKNTGECMGGRGSGRHFGWDAKRTMESQCGIDIRWLKKHGCLQDGRVGSLSWANNGRETGSIRYVMEKNRMLLHYLHRTNDGEWQTVEQSISFDRTPCNYGGFRVWFLCPRCMRRVAVLYGAGKYFLCRHCYNLAYASQRETPPFRLVSKAQKIRKRLGASMCTDEPILKKPKGMHQKTFDRLRNESEEATARAWREAGRLWGPLDLFS